jgi:hypothetical protein
LLSNDKFSIHFGGSLEYWINEYEYEYEYGYEYGYEYEYEYEYVS